MANNIAINDYQAIIWNEPPNVMGSSQKNETLFEWNRRMQNITKEKEEENEKNISQHELNY